MSAIAGFLTWTRRQLDQLPVGMVLAGLLMGISASTVSRDVVTVPVLGAVPGVVVGVTGVLVSAAAFGLLRRRSGCACGGDCDC